MVSPYVSRIREKVGSDLLVLPSVALVLRNDRDRMVLVKHAVSRSWSVPGGVIEPGERPEEAARRHAEAQVGQPAGELELLTVCSGPEFETRQPNGDRVCYVMTVWSARLPKDDLTPDGEAILDARFVDDGERFDLETPVWLEALLREVGGR